MSFDYHGLFNYVQSKTSQNLDKIPNFCGDYTQEKLNDDDEDHKECTDLKKTMLITRYDTLSMDYYMKKTNFSEQTIQQQKAKKVENKQERKKREEEKLRKEKNKELFTKRTMKH